MKWIDFSSNQLAEVNFTSSCSLSSLEEIYLSDNQLTSLPETAFQATQSLTILVVNSNRLTALPRCALQRFYGYMDTFDISDNPLLCDCKSNWLTQPHTIMIEKQSQCSNLEFTDTSSFSSKGCQPLPPCVDLDKCLPKVNNLMYSSVTDKLMSEYTPTSPASSTLRNEMYPHLLIFNQILLYYYFAAG